MLRELSIGLLLIGSVSPAYAQAGVAPKSVTRTVTGTVTITAINKDARSITLRAENGDEDSYTVGPAVVRFDQLKVGDTIKATYSESLIVQVRQAGAPPHAAAAAVTAARSLKKPGGEMGAVITATVTVTAVDLTGGSITVATADGHTRMRKIADKKNLEGIKVGDTLDITYTQSLLVSADAAK